MKNVLIAMDSFKESLTSLEAAEAIKRGLGNKFQTEIVEIADGGEGFKEIVTKIVKGHEVEVETKDPLGRDIKSSFGISENKDIAIIDVASSSGIERLKQSEKNPLTTSSYGTGQLIKAALDYNPSQMLIGLGSSATNDLGFGILSALGVKFLDDAGEIVKISGDNLKLIQKIDVSEIDQRIFNVEIKLASDVDNPLTGETGATKVFAKQKGATPQIIEQLEAEFIRLNKMIKEFTAIDLNQVKASGAAGGIGGGLYSFLDAKLVSGSDLINELNQVEVKVKAADIIITGEGKFDLQSLNGKGPMSIINLAQKYQKQVIVICGSVDARIYEVPQVANIVIQPCLLKLDTLENTLANANQSVEIMARNMGILLK